MKLLHLLFSLLLVLSVGAQVKYKTVPVRGIGPTASATPYKKTIPASSVAARTLQPRTVVDVVYASPIMKAFAQLMKSAGGQIYRNGVYTIFAPSDTAMKRLPVGIAGQMYMPENQGTTSSIIKYHVLQGRFTEADIIAAIKNANGYAAFNTVLGRKVIFSMTGNYVKVTDEEGHTANIRFSHLTASNGMVHVIDKVLMPKD